MISEIYWDNNNNWTIELYADTNLYGSDFYNSYFHIGYDTLFLDTLMLNSLSGSSYFIHGLKVRLGEVILITEKDLETPFYINYSGR